VNPLRLRNKDRHIPPATNRSPDTVVAGRFQYLCRIGIDDEGPLTTR
jgi:hypothetical protein